jgi:hypothetical protein
MKERDATAGTKLLALILAEKRGTTVATQLQKMTQQASYPMNKLFRRASDAAIGDSGKLEE